MQIIIASLIIGICIGYFNLLPNKITDLAHYLILGGLFILLFVMGFEIGNNDRILQNLDQIGLEAILLAGSSIIGSVAMILIFASYFKED
ncbi:MAG: LysO family transporter [Bacillota bacterium]